MNELSNCSKCGNIFVKTPFKDICHDCFKEEEKMYETIYQYLRKKENRKANLSKVVEDTDISEDLILKFIRDGRLKLALFPNLAYPCENCGTMIRTGRMCQTCSHEITSELKVFEREELRRKELEEREKRSTYFSGKNRNE